VKDLHQIKTIVLTAFAPIVWGSTYIVTTELLPAESPLLAATIRALPAGLLLVLFGKTLPSSVWLARLGVLGFLNIGLFFYCLFFAATYLPGGMAAMVMSIQPVVVILLSWWLLSVKVSAIQLIASVVGIFGIALLVLNSTAKLDLVGLIVANVGTLSMASGVVLTKKWGRPTGMSVLNFTGWQLLFGGLMLLPVAIWFEGVPHQLTLMNALGYLYLSVIGAVVGYFLWFRGIDQLPTTTVSFLGFLSSVSACILGYIVLDQHLSVFQLLGALLVLVSIVLASHHSSGKSTLSNQTPTVRSLEGN